MKFLEEYIGKIGYYIVFSSLVRLFVPDDKFRAYIDMFLRLIFMIILLSPVISVVKTELPHASDYIYKGWSDMWTEIKDYDNYNKNIIAKEYEALVSERVLTIAEAYGDDIEVNIETENETETEKITIEGKIDKEKEENLEDVLKSIYGSDTEIIIIGEGS